jgi:hypothetical protein
MRKIFLAPLAMSTFCLVLVLLSFAKIAMADTTGTVTATVTAQNISISVTDGSITYGTLALDASKSTLTGGVDDQQTATNNGNVAEDFTIKGANSSSGDWILDSANTTASHYIHKFCVASCGTEASPTNFTALTTGDVALGAGNVAPAGTQTFDLRITTPQTTSGNGFNQQTIPVTVTASAHS